MYRAGRLRRVFRARGKLVGTSDFVVTKGYVQIRVGRGDFGVAKMVALCREMPDVCDAKRPLTMLSTL